jgi:hypothetical protein
MSAIKMKPNPATVRSRRLRDERAKEGIKELRGVYVPLELHTEAKEAIKEWLRLKLAAVNGRA